MKQSFLELSIYRCDEGFAVRYKHSDGRRLMVKVPTCDAYTARREAIELLVEALTVLRAECSASELHDERKV